MTVKDRIGRRRYIIVEDSEELLRVIKRIKEVDKSAKIIKIGGFALVRCKHWFKGEVIKKLNEMGIQTYKTTGTIKKAKKIIKGLAP